MDIQLMEQENVEVMPAYYEEDVVVVDEPFVLDEAVAPLFSWVIRWLVYAAVFLTPVLFLPFTSDTLDLNKQILLIIIVAVGLVLYLVDVIRTGVLRIRNNIFYWPILGLIGAAVLTTIFSVSSWTSVFGTSLGRSSALITWLALAILFFLAVNTDEDNGRTLTKILNISIVVALLYGVLQMLGWFIFSGPVFGLRFFNTVGSLNSLGILAAISIPLFSSLGLARDQDSGLKEMLLKGINYFGFVLAVFILVVLNIWQLWAVMSIGLLASVVFVPLGGDKVRRLRHFAIPIILIVVGIFLTLINFNLSSVKRNLPPDASPSIMTSYNIVINALKQRPLGYGPENFSVIYDQYKPADISGALQSASRAFGTITFSKRATQVTTWLAEGGIPMAAALIFFLWYLGMFTIRQVKNSFGFDQQAGRIWAAFTAIVVGLFLLPYNLTLIAILVIFLTLSVVAHQSEDWLINLENNSRYSFVGSLLFIIGLVAALVGGYFAFSHYIADVHLANALATSDKEYAIKELNSAVDSNDKNTEIYRALAQALINKLAADSQQGIRKGESRDAYNARMQQIISSAVNAGLKATQNNPNDAQNWLLRGFVYQNLIGVVGGADQAALTMYKEAVKRSPNEPTIYFQMGNAGLTAVKILQGMINKPPQGFDASEARRQIVNILAQAEKDYAKAVELDNNFGQALVNLGIVYDAEDKLPEAIKQFEKLQTSKPDDASIPFQLGLLYYRNNEKNKALEAWQRAVALFPNYSNARWYLSLAYEERGDMGNALDQAREIEKINPDNQLVKERITKLEEGILTIPPEKILDQKPIQ